MERHWGREKAFIEWHSPDIKLTDNYHMINHVIRSCELLLIASLEMKPIFLVGLETHFPTWKLSGRDNSFVVIIFKNKRIYWRILKSRGNCSSF